MAGRLIFLGHLVHNTIKFFFLSLPFHLPAFHGYFRLAVERFAKRHLSAVDATLNQPTGTRSSDVFVGVEPVFGVIYFFTHTRMVSPRVDRYVLGSHPKALSADPTLN
jgi:hypothetical protein